MKKFFIKICKFFGFEIIDQNEFTAPTLNKELNEDLSILNKKSIVLPLGEVKITRKVKSMLIVIRVNTKIENLDKIKEIIKDVNGEIISLDTKKFEAKIKKQKTQQTFSNLASLYQCFEIGKEIGEDLIFFIEDDYLHFETMLEEMIATYERVSTQVGKDIFMCPADYPYLYMNNEKTNILIGNKRHWRTIAKTLCTFLTSKKLLDLYWENFTKNCEDRHDPFEKYINEIYKNEFCISPLKSLSVHLTNVNSSYGLSPFIDYKNLWDQNK